MPEAAPGPTSASPSARNAFGTFLSRVMVPLWVLAGAAFKLYERNPGNLPSGIRDLSRSLNFENLDALLRVLIGLEFFAVGVMFLMPRFARAMAIFMLSCFCIILIREIASGAATCGCFGSLPMKPWHMLAIDGTLLLLIIIFPSGAARSAFSATGALSTAAVIAVVGMAVALAVPNPAMIEQTQVVHADQVPPTADTQPLAQSPAQPANADPTTQPSDESPAPPPPPPPPVSTTPAVPANLRPTVNPSPKALPPSWYTQEMDKWIGKPWRDLDIFQLMPKWPRDMDKGPRYIIFYSRTCEHCRDMLDMELINPLDGLITLVEVPASRTVMTDPNGWEMPMSVEMVLEAELLQLPLGPNWIITTPMIIKTVDGKVVCATEGGDHKKCLGLP